MWLKTLSIISEGQHAAWNKLIKCKNEQQFRLEARKEKKKKKKTTLHFQQGDRELHEYITRLREICAFLQRHTRTTKNPCRPVNRSVHLLQVHQTIEAVNPSIAYVQTRLIQIFKQICITSMWTNINHGLISNWRNERKNFKLVSLSRKILKLQNKYAVQVPRHLPELTLNRSSLPYLFHIFDIIH